MKFRIENKKICDLEHGKATLRSLLPPRKVLLLDDVDGISQLEYLAKNLDWFGHENRVIVTTRNEHILKSHDAPFSKHEIEILNEEKFLGLFCHKHFIRN